MKYDKMIVDRTAFEEFAAKLGLIVVDNGELLQVTNRANGEQAMIAYKVARKVER